MPRATGIGGVFFPSPDPDALRSWYVEHLGLPLDDEGYVVFQWGGPDDSGSTVWHAFLPDTDYFGAARSRLMLNYRVDDLDGLVARLRGAGVRVDDVIHDDGVNGRFAWAWDPEGNRFELWEPLPGK